MGKYNSASLDRDRAFDMNSLNELLACGREILTQAVSISERMEASISAISGVYSGIDAGYKVRALGSDIASLSGKLEKQIYQDTMNRMEKIITKLTNDMPSYDSSLAQSVDSIREVLDAVKGRVDELKGLLDAGDVSLSYPEFSRRLNELKAGWEATTEDLAELLAEIEADMCGVTVTAVQYSADPVNLSTGNFVYDHEDLKIGGEIPLSFHRYYNARSRIKGSLGRCFVHNYEMYLEEDEVKGKVTISMGDGQKKSFRKEADGAYRSLHSATEALGKEGDSYVLRRLSGESWHFDASGRLTRHENGYGRGTSFCYDAADRLERAVTDNGAYLTYSYNEAGQISCVKDHTGRDVNFSYEKGKLSTVKDSRGGVSIYHYGKNGRIEETVNPRGYVAVKNTYDEKRRVTRQEFPDGSHMEYDYDDSKRQVILTERNGSHTTYVHDSKYRNTDILYEDGTKEHFEYNANNQKILHVDRNGNTTRMAYDNRGNMTQVINASGAKLSITYDAHNMPLNIKINGKEKQKNTFDEKGNILEVTDALFRKLFFTYNKTGLPEEVVLPDGSVIHMDYDERGNIIKYSDAKGGITHYGYDSLNRIVEVTDPNGNVTHFSYDRAGNIKELINGAGFKRTYEYNESNKVTKIIDFDGSIIQRAYNALDKPEKITDQMGRVTELQYDPMWNLARVTKPNGAVTTYSYNGNNHLNCIKDAYGNEKRYTYDGNGNRLSETDENGFVTNFSYDAWGHLIHVEGPDGIKYDYAYDDEGNLTEVKDALGGKINMEYDAAGQLICETNQLGESRNYTYNPMGKVESIIDETGRKTTYEYLPGGLLKKIIYPEMISETYTYDRNGNIKTHTNTDGFIWTYSYDSLNQVDCIAGSDGEKKTYTYDAVGNITSITDSLGNITKYEYTLTGQLSRVIDALDNETEYIYDECDHLTGILQYGKRTEKERECHITRYERDLLGRVRTVVDSLGLKEYYKYDPKGQLLEKIDKEGYVTRYGYTSQGDVSHIQYADGREVKLSYNSLRQLQEMEDWLGTMKMETDLLGRATKVVYQDQKEVSYTYGKAGRRTSITYPDGRKVFYEYDKDLRLSALKENDKTINYDYDKNGRLIRKSFPNQVVTNYLYNAKGQIEQLTHMDKNGIIDRFTYQYDLLGNKTGIIKERRGMPEENGSYTFVYDPVGRIERVTKNEEILRTYSYDAFGNRTKLTEEGKETAYTYNTMNQLLLKRDCNGETRYTFDKRGNLTQVIENGKNPKQYFYGAIDQLEQAVGQNGETAQYLYNGLGFRIGKNVGGMDLGKTIRYTIDLTRQYHNLLQKEEKEVSNHIQTYLWDGNVAGMLDDAMSGSSYFLQDEMGSAVRLTDINGKPIINYGYDEFGRDLYRNQAVLQPFGYTGYQYDDIAETYFAQEREYDCVNGRFGSIDLYKGTIYRGDTINSYIYCINNPLSYLDPLGLEPAWLEGIWAHTQIEYELQYKQFPCANTRSNVRIPGAGLGVTGLGIADFLVDKGTHVEIYEIKPDSWSSGYPNVRAFGQLDRYVTNYMYNNNRPVIRGTQVFEDSLPFYKDPTRTLTYWSDGSGVIYYKISPKPKAKPENLPSVVPDTAFDSKEEKNFNLALIGTCVLAGLFTVATLVEDAFTGGAGVADDAAIPVVWTWALSFGL